MDQIDPKQPDEGTDAETSIWRQVRWSRVLSLVAAMSLAGSFWWFLARVLMGA